MPKHTPGPWEVRNLAVWAAGGKVLDSPGGDLDQIDADLQLAAAAPDLLAACERLVFGGLNIAADYEQARAAIAKARGELCR